MERNLSHVSGDLARAGVAVRPHWKTSKCLEVARRQLALGAVGFTCSTPSEVRALGEAGIRGLLWAHLPVGAPKVAFAVEAVARSGTCLLYPSAAADDLLRVDLGLRRI